MNPFDILLLIIVLAGTYYGFIKGLSQEIIHVLKVFVMFIVGGTYCVDVSLWLTQLGILKSDNYAMFLLVGFLILAALFWGVLNFLEKKVIIRYIYKKPMVNKSLGAFLLALEAGIIFSLSVILLMQLALSKRYLSLYIVHGYSYPRIHTVTMNILNVRRVQEIMNGNITGGSKEVLINLMGK